MDRMKDKSINRTIQRSIDKLSFKANKCEKIIWFTKFLVLFLLNRIATPKSANFTNPIRRIWKVREDVGAIYWVSVIN